MHLPDAHPTTPLQAALWAKPFGAQARLARHLQVSQTTVSRWASGELTVPDYLRPLIADALGRSVEEIFPDLLGRRTPHTTQEEPAGA